MSPRYRINVLDVVKTASMPCACSEQFPAGARKYFEVWYKSPANIMWTCLKSLLNPVSIYLFEPAKANQILIFYIQLDLKKNVP